MLEWLRELTTPLAANEETVHREFVLRAVLISSNCLLTVYLLIDWLFVVPIRGTLAFGDFFWPPILPLLLFG